MKGDIYNLRNMYIHSLASFLKTNRQNIRNTSKYYALLYNSTTQYVYNNTHNYDLFDSFNKNFYFVKVEFMTELSVSVL